MDSISQETLMLLMLSSIKGVGDKKLLSFLSIPNFKEFSFDEIFFKFLKGNKSEISTVKPTAMLYAEEQIAEAKKREHKIISIFDYCYPSQLKFSNDAPAILFVAGNINILNKKSVAVIGTRDPTEHGKIICERLTKSLIDNNWVVVSGLAKGIDSISHDTCVKHNGQTIAVMAQGLEKIYPAENRELAKKILDTGGALVSEYPYNSHTGRSNFVKRDATQAGLSSSVFLVQTGVNGGSLHASRAILKYGRPLVVVGQSKTDENTRPENAEGSFILLKGEYKDAVNILGFKFDENLLIKMKDKDDLLMVNSVLNNFTHTNYKQSNDFKLI
ncbi:DNA-processing protein DprA [Aeromonas hydrophila]|uniref:DNA-processing protein DprA n=1 Tax=Aeromonas hydrophila TaxID=644 RepID=UPI0009BF21E5|nr:DNA-processing protein DprA [Aeromonas hydrophila]